MSSETTRTPLRRPTATATAAAAVLALAMAPSPALAHDALIDSSPGDGATLDAVPEEVVLTFNNEPLANGSASTVVVTGPDERTYTGEAPLDFDGTDVTAELLPLDQAGDYTVAFRIVSSDGHPIQDTLEFTLTEEAVTTAAEEVPAETDGQETAVAEETSEEAAPETPAVEADEQAVSGAEEGTGGKTLLLVLGAVLVLFLVLSMIVLVRARLRGIEAAKGDE
ncbi:copper resistance CopC family protein [Nocardiopsis sp. CNT312]|uniref:copper resistance CopC family protein n=1 Tax=Nocardiopsis sp. CNT312 TaxID=1137268 RepID=UPI0004BC07E2|nr:copper resistance CopC family protein [Nocardiopsis sp. CNT312]